MEIVSFSSSPHFAIEPIHPLWLLIRNGLIGLMVLYIIGLGGYLALRVVASGKFWWLALADNFTPTYFLPLLLIVPLALLLREYRVVGSATLLLLIALIWFGQYFLLRTSAQVQGTPLKIITFNLYPYNQKLEEVAAWIIGEDADLVLLQETPEVIGAAFAPLYEIYPNHVFQSHENGYLIFSRFPIIHQPDSYYTDEVGWYLHQRVEVDVNGQPLVLYNVHTKMPHRSEPHINLPLIPDFVLRYDESVRNQQIERLVDEIDAEQYPVVMTGDFNMGEYASVYPILSAKLTDAYRISGHGFGFTWPGGSSEELPDILSPLVRLDYVWHTQQLKPISAEVGPRLGSDHLPLVVTLDLR